MSPLFLATVSNSTIQGSNGVISPFSIDNLVLLVTAVIGLVGSYTIYRLRLRTRRRRLRKALRGEIKAMAPGVYEKARIMAAEDRDTDLYIPADPTIMAVFSNNSGEIGLLSDDELEEVIELYGTAAAVRQRIDNLSTMQDPNKSAVLQLRTELIQLNNTKNLALKEIECALGIDRTSGGIYHDIEDPGFDYQAVLEQELDEE